MNMKILTPNVWIANQMAQRMDMSIIIRVVRTKCFTVWIVQKKVILMRKDCVFLVNIALDVLVLMAKWKLRAESDACGARNVRIYSIMVNTKTFLIDVPSAKTLDS